MALSRVPIKRHLCTTKLWSAFANDSLPDLTGSASQHDSKLPTSCNVLVCGGGIAGLSAAYQLASLGRNINIVVVDQRSFGSGATNRGLGLISGIRTIPVEGQLAALTLKFLKDFSKQHDIGYKQNGSLYLAQSPNRLLQLKRFNSLYSRHFQCEIVGKSDVERLHPHIDKSDIVGALYVPNDVVVDPTALVNALVVDLRRQGVILIENCTVNKIETKGRRVVGVQTSLGRIECNNFINAAGSWASQVGALSVPVVRVAQQPCTQLVYTSQPLKELTHGKKDGLPVVRDYDSSMYFYIRPEDSSVVLTGFETVGNPITRSRDVPHAKKKLKTVSHSVGTVVSDSQVASSWDRLTPLLGSIIRRLPLINQSNVGQLASVAESYTPDGAWIIGKSPKLDNYWVCCAGNSSGLSAAFGMGNILASWIADEFPPADYDVWSIDVQRFLPFHSNSHYLQERMKEAVSLNCWPYLYSDATSKLRPMRTTPLYAYQLQQGAFFFAQNSFERPQFFDPTITVHDHNKPTYRRPAWFEMVEREYWACRRDVAVIDMSAFTKVELRSSGREVVDMLQKLCANNMDRPPGTVIHTGMLNERGGFENDCTVLRLDENWYFIISVPAQHVKVYHYLQKYLPSNGAVQARDVTSMYTALNCIGPDAEELLYKLSGTRVTKAEFPAMTCKILNIAQAADVLVMRLTHSGEDGFMLYVPSEYALHVYTALCNERDFGVQLAGYHALRSLRIERLFLYWGSDLSPSVTPLECDREARVDFSKPYFLGKKALMEEKQRGIYRRVVQLLLHPDRFNPHWVDAWPWSSEPVYRNGEYVGLTTSCGYGYSLERMVCLAYIRNANPNEPVTLDYLTSGHYEVEIAGQRYPAAINLYPPKLPLPEASLS